MKKKSRILIADDIPSNLKLLTLLMEDMGYPHVLARDGQEVLDILEKEKIDLIIMDINMPKVDGLTAAQKIREKDWDKKNIPIIILSAFASREKREQCFLNGVNDFIVKPVIFDSLQKTIEKWAL
ncbi:MAG: response regulator [Candidatus Aureabacteria bacterium]|nr:response regulator [Candidatus Auribacterota bacterium]